MKLFYCFFLNEESEVLIFLSSISLYCQPNKERVHTDNLKCSRIEYGSCSCNQLMALYIFESTKLTIGEKVNLKIQAKSNSINDSFTLENLCKGKKYLKIDFLQFDFLIQVGKPTASIVIHNVLNLNWNTVVCFYGELYWNPNIVYCGINNKNKTSILVQCIEVKDGLFNRNNDILLP